MARNDKKKKDSKYRAKLRARMTLAKKLKGGFFIVKGGKNAGHRMPRPMPILKAMTRGEIIPEG